MGKNSKFLVKRGTLNFPKSKPTFFPVQRLLGIDINENSSHEEAKPFANGKGRRGASKK
jgi:hypothetical protein